MASEDIYLRKDVYEADQRALLAEIKLGNNEILKVFDQHRSEMRDFRGEVNDRFSKLEAQVVVLTGRVDGLERRIGSLENFVTAGISFIAMLVTLTVFLMPISRFMRRFWKPNPTITLGQVEELLNAKLAARQQNSSPVI